MAQGANDSFYDVAVIGGGPAGLSAAIYLARACYRVLVIEKERFGGQIAATALVVNYPGIGRISGVDLTENMRKQAEGFGAEFLLADVTSVDLVGDVKTLSTSRGKIKCFGVIIATGARPRKVGFDGEEKFQGRGVAYCSVCDGEFFTGRDVFVIGGGFAAAQESVFLTKYARHVTVLIRGDGFSCAKQTAAAALSHPKITVKTGVEPVSAEGGSRVERFSYRVKATGEIVTHAPTDAEPFGVFVFAGNVPDTDLFKGVVHLDPQGYVITDKEQRTNVPGVYAAGDVCVKPLRQVVTAVGDGATAATELEKYASEMQMLTGVVPHRPNGGATVADKEEKQNEKETQDEASRSELFTNEMIYQLRTMFAKMQSRLVLELHADDSPKSAELRRYLEELTALTDKLSIKETQGDGDHHLPFVTICRSGGESTGATFHGVPGGHEFTPFVLGLYNAAGPGQSIDEKSLARARAISRRTNIHIFVSLSCTMCPELVTAAARLALENELIATDVYDLALYEDLRERYNVLSVPCIVFDDRVVSFGKKNIDQLIELLSANAT